MRGWTILILVILGIVAWILLCIFGPQVKKTEAQFQDPGLIFLTLVLVGWISERYMYKYCPMLYMKGYHTTLFSGDPVAEVELPKIPGSTRSNKFFVYKAGGTDWLKKSGGGSKGYVIANSDLVKKTPGDTAHVFVNSAPELFRRNPKGQYEKDINKLPPEFLTILTDYGFDPNRSPVFVAYDPPKVQMDDKEVKELLKYKELYEEQNRVTQDLRKLLKDTQTIISQQANVHKSSMAAVQGKIDEGQPRKIVRRRSEEEDDEQR